MITKRARACIRKAYLKLTKVRKDAEEIRKLTLSDGEQAIYPPDDIYRSAERLCDLIDSMIDRFSEFLPETDR